MGQGEGAGAGGKEGREGECRLRPVGDEPNPRDALGLQLPQALGGAPEGGGVGLDGDGQNAVLDLGLVGKGLSVSAADPIGLFLGARQGFKLGALSRPGVRDGAAGMGADCGFRAVCFIGGILVVNIGFKQMPQLAALGGPGVRLAAVVVTLGGFRAVLGAGGIIVVGIVAELMLSLVFLAGRVSLTVQPEWTQWPVSVPSALQVASPL